MHLYENNRSSESLTVGRLTVLGGLESDTINTIHTHLQTTEEKQRKIIADMEKLHTEISADGVITAAEKQLLKKEMTIIETEYPIVITKAEQAQKDAADITAYKNAYNRLHTYLYQDLHVFDDMHNPLTIDRFPFNKVFAEYYSCRTTLQINADGLTHYTWIKFAKDAHGTDMSDYPDMTRRFMGIAENRLTETESDDPAEYRWIDMQGVPGQKGDQGIPGKNGTDGKPKFTWVKYADTATGGGLSDRPDGKAYIGFAFNKESQAESNKPNDYHWQRVKGEPGVRGLQGLQGEKGEQGIAGKNGIDGKTSYFHIKYSPNPNGYPMSETPAAYIGTYVDYSQQDSPDYTKYTWSKFFGTDGKDGIPGKNGIDGKTSYLHIAYANSPDGRQGFDIAHSAGKTYIGTYTDFIQADSTNPSRYTWSKIKGEQGIQGIPGKNGKDGTTKFLPSLTVSGDYENQIGTFQGLLYRWINGKWELLNAVMPVNPVAFYDFENLPEFPDNLNDIYNKHFNNWLKKAENILTHKNMNWICINPNSNKRLVSELGDGIFTVEALEGYTGGYISPFDTPNKIFGKIVYMEFEVLTGSFDIGCSYNNKRYSVGKYVSSVFIYKDKTSFYYYGNAGSKIKINKLLLIDRIGYEDNLYYYCVEPNGKEERRTVEVTERGSFTVEVNQNTVSGFYISSYATPNPLLGKIIILKFRIITGTWLIGCKGGKSYSEKTVQTIVEESDGDAFICYSEVHKSKIEIIDLYIGDGSMKNAKIFDASGNKNHLDILGEKKYFAKTVEGVKGVFLKKNTFFKSSTCDIGEQFTISLKIAHQGLQGQTHHIFNINGFSPFILNNNLVGYPPHFGSQNLEAGKLYHIIFTVDTDYVKIWVDNKYFGGIKKHEEINSKKLLLIGTILDYSFYNGFIAQALVFDRILTEQEALWLYLNPQYPVKNYTAADWLIDKDNPDNVIANATPKYLGVVETVPATRTAIITKGERLGAQDANTGDWVLMGKTASGWKVGICYKWNGVQWIALEPAQNYVEEYHACLFHICEIEELMQNTGHFGALFSKVLVAQKALIDELVANQAFIEQLIVKRLKIDSDKNSEQDFELRIDEDNGISAQYNNKVVFEVSKTGNALFSGDIITPPFELRQGVIKSYTLNYKNRLIAEIIKNTTYVSSDALPYIGYIKCKGTFNKKNITAISNYISKGTKTYENVILWNYKRLRRRSRYCIGDTTYSTQVFELNIYMANGNIESFTDSILLKKIKDTEKREIEYILSEENDSLYNAFSPNEADFRPSRTIADLSVIINEGATTMLLKHLPHGNGDYEFGSIFIENGFLKIKE